MKLYEKDWFPANVWERLWLNEANWNVLHTLSMEHEEVRRPITLQEAIEIMANDIVNCTRQGYELVLKYKTGGA